MNLVGLRLGQEVGQLADLDLVARAPPGGVDQDQVDVAQLVDRAPHLARGVGHGQGQVDDLGIGPELFDGRDPVGVDGHQPRPEAVSQLEVGRELGHRRRLADAGRPDQRHHPPRARHRRDRRGRRHARLDRVAQRLADASASVRLVGLEPLGDVPDQPAGQDLGHIGFEKLRVRRHQLDREGRAEDGRSGRAGSGPRPSRAAG